MCKKIFYILIIVLSFIHTSYAQMEVDSSIEKINAKSFSTEASMINSLNKDGKIYIVITVISIILIGLFFYLFQLDRKISKIEKQIK
jgi:CcmD family protein